MNFRAVRTILLREIKVHLRDRLGVISSVARSVLWLLIFGGGFGAARFSGLEVGYQEFLFPGVVAMSLLFTSIRSGISVIWDREFGFMKEILVSPASRFSIMAGKVLGGATISVFEGMLILFLGPFLGIKFSFFGFVIAFPLMFLISLSLVSIGLIVASIMKTFEGFQSIMTFLIMPMFFLSGALFPVDKLPLWMKPLLAINPLTYGVDSLRFALVGLSQHGILFDVGILTISAAVTMTLGIKAFNNKE